MDIIPRFYIFGVPDGFDILDGTSAEIAYFQKFYNDSTENTKFGIHRDAKGNITYAYLKYNLSSGKSRTGSFFGMSLIFNNVYCANPLRLYELFDWVYNSYVVIDEEKEKQGKEVGFIRTIKNNKEIQARYDITRFQEKREYIQHYIKSVLLGNINKEFKDAFCVIDSSFSNEHPNLVVQEPKESVSNEKLLADLQQYNRVAVSPDWAPKIPPKTGNSPIDSNNCRGIVLAPEYIVSLLDYTKGYQSYIIESLSDLESADVEMANAVFKEVNSRLKEVKSTPSTDKRVLQIITDYTTLTEQLQSLIQKIEDGPTPPPPPTPPTPTPWWKNPKKLALGGVAAVVIFLLVILICKPSETIKPEEEQQTRIIKEVRDLIYREEYMEAYNKAKSLNNVERREHLQDSALCLNVDQVIKSTSHKYSEAYINITPKINKLETRNQKNTELVDAWESYIDEIIKGIEKDKDKKKAGEWKTNINSENSIGGISKKLPEFKQRLEAVINPSVQSPNEKPQVQSYEIHFMKTDRKWKNIDENPIVVKGDKKIYLDNGSRLVYCIIKKINGSNSTPINDPESILTNDDNLKRTSMSSDWGDGWYGVSAGGTITIKKGDFNCKITIVNN